MYSPQNTNLAYDLSLFDTDERVEKKIQERAAEPIKMAERSVAKSGSILKTLVCVVAAASILFAVIYSKASISELSMKISSQESLLQEAETENVRLQAQLDNMVTLSKVEDYAVNVLGLQKISTSQEKYVTVNTESTTKVAENTEGSIFLEISDWFKGVVEYLGF